MFRTRAQSAHITLSNISTKTQASFFSADSWKLWPIAVIRRITGKMLPAKLNCILNFALPYSCDHVTCVYKLACNCYCRAFDKATYHGTASLQVVTPLSKQKRPPLRVVTLQFLIHAKSTRTFTTKNPPGRQWL